MHTIIAALKWMVHLQRYPQKVPYCPKYALLHGSRAVRRILRLMTDWLRIVLPKSATHDELNCDRTAKYVRPATVTTNCAWSFLTGIILYTRI